MFRTRSILIITLFCIGIFIVPTNAAIPAARPDQNVSLSDEVINNRSKTSELPNDRVFRVAFYNETNTTVPDYGVGVLQNNYTLIHDVLFASDYDVSLVTAADIENYQLTTANYDVVILPDNIPRENITNHVKDFWLAGGGVLAINSAAAYLVYGGILPSENESVSNGYGKWWAYEGVDTSIITEITPVSQSYANGSELIHDIASFGVYSWDLLSKTSTFDHMRKIAVKNGTHDYVTAISIDDPDRGGKAVYLGTQILDFPTAWESLLLDAIGWLAPRPKAKIAYDFSHQPRLSVDSWDEFSTVWTAINSYAELRNTYVSRRYTFDKFMPDSGGNFTEARLSDYDIMVICWPDLNYTAAERTALLNWVSGGGALVLMGDRNGFIGGGDGYLYINFLLEDFDMYLGENDTQDNQDCTFGIPRHPTTELCSSIRISYRNYIYFRGNDAKAIWNEAGKPVVAAHEYGDGRVVLTADINIFDNSLIDESDNRRFGINIANWLSADNAEVLLYTDDPYHYNYYRNIISEAMNQLQIPYFAIHSELGLNASLNGTWYGDEWSLVIIDNCNNDRHQSYPHILDYLKTGRQLIMSSWTLGAYFDDPLWRYMGMNYTENWDFNEPAFIWDATHPIFDSPIDYGAPTLNVSQVFFGDDGDKLQIFDNATALAGFTESPEDGNASIVLRNDGQTLFNGFLLNNLHGDIDESGYVDGFEIYINEITFMMSLPDIDHPADMQYESGTTGHAITWNPSDGSPDTYEVYIDGSQEDSGSWDGSAITVNVDGLSLGTHIIELRVYGTYGHARGDIVRVAVVDTTDPQLNSPADITITVGSTGNALTWLGSEANPSHYVITMNGTEWDSGEWDGSQISIDLDSLDTGIYFFKVRVNDTVGHYAEDNVVVTVTESSGLLDGLDTTTLLLIAIGVLVLIIIVLVVRRRK